MSAPRVDDLCVKSEYKDDRHQWAYSPTWDGLRIAKCKRCGAVSTQLLTDSGGQPGDVWEEISRARVAT